MHVSLIPTTPLLAMTRRREEEGDDVPIMPMINWLGVRCALGPLSYRAVSPS